MAHGRDAAARVVALDRRVGWMGQPAAPRRCDRVKRLMHGGWASGQDGGRDGGKGAMWQVPALAAPGTGASVPRLGKGLRACAMGVDYGHRPVPRVQAGAGAVEMLHKRSARTRT